MTRGRRRDDSGAVVPFLAVAIALLVTVAAFAVDLGMQRVLRRDMQALADVVALDLSRQIPRRTKADLMALAPAVVSRTLGNNKHTLGDGDGADDDPEIAFDFGTVSQAADGSTQFTSGSPTSFPNAVKVTASNDVDFSFTPGGGSATRTAIATVQGGACFGIGSYAAALDAGSSPLLGPILGALGADIDLTVGDYQALADAELDLLDFLGVDVGAGTMQDVLDGGQLIGLGDFYLATAKAVGQENTAAVSALQALALAVAPLNLSVPVADLLSLGTGGAAGLDAQLNALDLVTAAVQAANGENAISIPQVGVDLGPLADVSTSLHIVEAPKVGCGRKNDEAATAQSSAVTVELDAEAVDLDLGLLDTRVSLSGEVRVASAKGRLTDVRCNPEGITVAVSDGLLEIDLTLEIRIRAVLGLVPAITGPIRLTGASTSTGDAVINIVGDDYDTPVRVDNSSSGLPSINVDTSALRALGLPVGGLLNIILDPLLKGLVNPLVKGLDTVLLTPLLRALGTDLSGADVFAKRAPRCDNPNLVG